VNIDIAYIKSVHPFKSQWRAHPYHTCYVVDFLLKVTPMWFQSKVQPLDILILWALWVTSIFQSQADIYLHFCGMNVLIHDYRTPFSTVKATTRIDDFSSKVFLTTP